jgi:hypothetical protein
MASALFEFAAERLEQSTDFERLEARGTLRLALKAAGLDADVLTWDQLRVVLERVLPEELENRGVKRSGDVCSALSAEIGASPVASAAGASHESSDEIFRRLGRD